MLRTHFHKNIVWFDFLDASGEKFKPLAKRENIDPYIINKFLNESNRDKAILLKDNLYLSLHFPDLKNSDYITQEIKFIIGRNYIITNQEVQNEGLDKFRHIFESNASFEKEQELDSCVVYSFLHMIEKIYENMIIELKNIEKKIDKIEEEIFKDNENKMVRKISETNRDLLDFRKNIKSHKETWNVFLHLTRDYFVKKASYNALDSILISYEKVTTIADELNELIHELRDTNNSLLSAKLSETSKTFTLVAFLTMPATLFFTIVSLPTTQNFFIGHPNDFTVIISISFVLFLIMLWITIWKKWW